MSSEQETLERIRKMLKQIKIDQLTPEQLLRLLLLTRKTREALANVSCGAMPSSAVQDLANAVPDNLVQAIVADNRRGISEPGWLPPTPVEPKPRTRGWQKPDPLGLPPGIKYVDQLCDVQDAVDRGENARRIAAAVMGQKIK